MRKKNMHYAKIAYEAYCKARNWESVKGEPLPHFEQQDPQLQEAWRLAAEAVAREIQNQTGPG